MWIKILLKIILLINNVFFYIEKFIIFVQGSYIPTTKDNWALRTFVKKVI
jgi:hypothetical protein